MRALTQFSLLTIAFLVAARPRAIERRDAVSGPGEEAASFAAADSVPQEIVKRHLEAHPKEAGQPFSPPWVPKKRAPEAEPKTVVGAFSVAGTAPRDIGKRLPEADPKMIEPSFAAVDSASQNNWKRSSEAEPKTVEPSFAAAGWALDTIMRRSPKAQPEDEDPSFPVVEQPHRLSPRFSKARKESEFHLLQ